MGNYGMKAFYPPWFESFAIAGLKVTCRVLQTDSLGPSPARVVRGILKRLLQEQCTFANPTPELCGQCSQAHECAFLNLMVEDRSRPQPYWVDLNPLGAWEGRIRAGTVLSFTCHVVGDRIPYLVAMEQALASKGKLEIDRTNIRLQVTGLELPGIHQPAAWTDELAERVLAMSDVCGETQEIVVNFVTPARMTHASKILTDPSDFGLSVFIEGLWKRAADLSVYLGNHCSPDEAPAPTELLPEAAHVRTTPGPDFDFFEEKAVRRNSSKAGRVERTGGFKGHVTFSGNILPFLPLLMIGEFIHIGKKTTQGLGRYVIENIR
jgi:hypothetical protein